MTHTVGSHVYLPKTTGAIDITELLKEPCYCDRVQPVNPQSVTQQWSGTVTGTAQNTITVPFYWPPVEGIYVPVTSPTIQIHYCEQTEINKGLVKLVEKLVDKIVTLEKSKTGTETVRPVKETKKEET